MEATTKPAEDFGKLISLQGANQPANIERVLEYIYKHLVTEVEYKREVNDELKERIQQLEKELQNYKYQTDALNAEAEYERKQHEGSRQLISKLLNDIKKYQNDIEWYKRTYETRSLMGTIKQKIFKKI